MSVWLVNTGWVGGGYGIGQRIRLDYTRTIITAVLSGALKQVSYIEHPIFGFLMPTTCPGIPSFLLNPSSTWQDAEAYTTQSRALAQAFIDNFCQYEDVADRDVRSGGPRLL